MPVTDAAVQTLLAPLSAVRAITSRKMFGGIGIYCDGVFFAVIDDDRLYFKVDEVNLPDYDEMGARQWVIEGPNGGAMPYRELPDKILNDPNVLGSWIDDSVRVAQTKKTKKK